MSHLAAVERALNHILLGKPQAVRLALACVLAEGHLLVEDIPGVGKTTLTLALAKVLGLSAQRVQFTSDLLPGDLLGASIYDRNTQSFRFVAGPVFTEVLMADEVNRASPKTQSALLEAMEERQVSVDGVTRALPSPFFVLATQNPLEQIGTYPLPESQLDRFLMRLSLGLPPRDAEFTLLKENDRRSLLGEMQPVLDRDALRALQAEVRRIRTTDPLLDYILLLAEATRSHPELRQGLSPRGALGLKRAAQAHALLCGRQGVLPEDVQAVFAPVVQHRLIAASPERKPPKAEAILQTVAIP